MQHLDRQRDTLPISCSIAARRSAEDSSIAEAQPLGHHGAQRGDPFGVAGLERVAPVGPVGQPRGNLQVRSERFLVARYTRAEQRQQTAAQTLCARRCGRRGLVRRGLAVDHPTHANQRVDTRQELLDFPLQKIDDDRDSWGFEAAHWLAYRQSLLTTVADWHRQKPESCGLHEYELAQLVSVKAPAVALRRAIIELIAERNLARKGSIVHIPTYGPQPGSDDLNLWAKVEPLVSGGGLRPPLARELAENLGIALKQLEGFLNRAAQSGWLIKVAGNRYFTPESVLRLATIAETLAAESDNGEFDPRSYRDRSGIGRNLSIEVLEYFDRAGLTRRTDQGRQISTPARDIFGSPAQV